VDVTDAPAAGDAAVMQFFETATRNLLAAEANAGVGHHVMLSLTGVERLLDSGYARAKFAQELLIERASMPFSIVRTTQFFESLSDIANAATQGHTVRVAPVRVQPIAADDVAWAIATAAVGAPVNGIVEIGGPEPFFLDELIQRVLGRRGDAREVRA